MVDGPRAPLQMPTLRVELDGIKQQVVWAIFNSQDEIKEAIKAQLTAVLASLTPDMIVASVRRAFDTAIYEAVQEQGKELVTDAVHEYFTNGPGADIVREALKQKFKL